MSFPPATEMFQFAGFAPSTYVFSGRYPLRGGLPHSDIHGSKLARSSPWLFAACHVLHRLSVPRHSPDALFMLDPSIPITRHSLSYLIAQLRKLVHGHATPRQRVECHNVMRIFGEY
jgi:hypothetical protein